MFLRCVLAFVNVQPNVSYKKRIYQETALLWHKGFYCNRSNIFFTM